MKSPLLLPFHMVFVVFLSLALYIFHSSIFLPYYRLLSGHKWHRCGIALLLASTSILLILDRQSTCSIFFPGLYSMSKLYSLSFSIHRYLLPIGFSWFIKVFKTAWSVKILNIFHPPKYWRNFSIAQTTATYSFSVIG